MLNLNLNLNLIVGGSARPLLRRLGFIVGGCRWCLDPELSDFGLLIRSLLNIFASFKKIMCPNELFDIAMGNVSQCNILWYDVQSILDAIA